MSLLSTRNLAVGTKFQYTDLRGELVVIEIEKVYASLFGPKDVDLLNNESDFDKVSVSPRLSFKHTRPNGETFSWDYPIGYFVETMHAHGATEIACEPTKIARGNGRTPYENACESAEIFGRLNH